MHRLIVLLLFSIFCQQLDAQINFENGYFISNSAERMECLIKNVGWKNNPTYFDFKFSTDSESRTKTIDEITEFGVGGQRFVKFKVKINRSSDLSDRLEANRTIDYEEEELLLLLLVEGASNLYFYEDGNLRRFFFSKQDENPTPLGYKRFMSDDSTISENNEYRQQIWNRLKCDGITRQLINKTDYKKNSLIDFFNIYNKCVNPDYIKNSKNENKFDLLLNLRPGINYSTLSTKRGSSGLNNFDFGFNIGYRIGLELEGILPFNKRKWSIFLEPTYQFYTADGESKPVSDINTTTRQAMVDYNSIEIPFGLRHYIFLNNNLNLYLNAGYEVVLPLNSGIVFNNSPSSKIDFGTTSNFIIGFGLKHKKIAFETRYRAKREVFDNDIVTSYQSNFHGFAFIIGYNIF